LEKFVPSNVLSTILLLPVRGVKAFSWNSSSLTLRLLPHHHCPTDSVKNCFLHEQWEEKQLKTWANTSYKLARLLLDPTAGDVVFIVRDADDPPKKLYAYKSILAGNSKYFKSGMLNPILWSYKASFETRMEVSTTGSSFLRHWRGYSY
jgi:hypothetical protein